MHIRLHMKILLVLSLLLSLSGYAAGNSPQNKNYLPISGDTANELARLNFLPKVKNGVTQVVQGEARVFCIPRIQLRTSSDRESYSCTFSSPRKLSAQEEGVSSLRIQGSDANQMASLKFLSEKQGLLEKFVTGVANIHCITHLSPMNSDENLVPDGYACKISDGKI